jgi:hypothetical protein
LTFAVAFTSVPRGGRDDIRGKEFIAIEDISKPEKLAPLLPLRAALGNARF